MEHHDTTVVLNQMWWIVWSTLNSCSLDFQETSTHSLPFRLFFSSPSLREIEDDPCRPCICVIKLTSIKVILLNTNWNEYFITNFSSVCFNTVRLRNVIKAGYLRWLDTVFQGQYLPSLSINYVAINKVIGGKSFREWFWKNSSQCRYILIFIFI